MIRLSASVLAVFVAANANAAECNFDKPVGKCIGSITIDSTGGSKPSYSAEITVSSTALTCSKVEWYLDGTPYQTILKSTNSDSDSVHGTKPISRKNFSSIKCTTYEGSDQASSRKKKSCMSVADVDQNIQQNQWAMQQIDLSKQNLARAEARGEGNYNAEDAAAVRAYIAKWEPYYPAYQRAVENWKDCKRDPTCVCK